ncbi:hypothetical protein [Novosphingobium rosa]|nr:hypothetical protein [Novosphingobium rosa]
MRLNRPNRREAAWIALGLLAFNGFLYACDRTVAGAVQCHMLGCTPHRWF